MSTAINKSGERGYSALNILPGLSDGGGAAALLKGWSV